MTSTPMKIALRVLGLALGLSAPILAPAHIVMIEAASIHESWIQKSEPGESTDGPAVARALELCKKEAKDCVLKSSKPTGIMVQDMGYKRGTAIFGKHFFGENAAEVSRAALLSCAKVAPKSTCRPLWVTISIKDGDPAPAGYKELDAEGAANYTIFFEGMKQKMRDLGVDMK